MQSEISASVERMAAELRSDDPIFLPSDFWNDLNGKNVRMLEIEGLKHFKRTVSQNYYNWLIAGYRHGLFQHVFRAWLRRPDIIPLLTRLKETDRLRLTTGDERVELSLGQRHAYRLYVSFVWSLMTRLDTRRLRTKLDEPEIGDPFRVMLGRKILSQDLANSIVECNVIADLSDGIRAPRIAELGAGYGRVAHAYASSLPGQYYIFDIPPALAVAEWYLERVLGGDRVFRFRRFDDLGDVADEMARASVVLLTPNQMRKFPDGYFDVTLSISTLPEMRPDQVELFLSELQRLSSNGLFLKQWKSWTNPSDGTSLDSDSYRLGPDWAVTLDREDPILPLFFNRAWKRRPRPTEA